MAAKVLLVEDDNNLREIYEARLQAEGYNIVTARDGEEALGVAKAEMPDLIISDVMMPRVSGFEMLDILRNTDGLKDAKVIMLTALGQADDRIKANSLGADRYLVKSQVTLEDIVKASHELLEGPAPQLPGGGVATPAAATAPAPATPATPATPGPIPVPVAPMPAPTLPPVQPEPVVMPQSDGLAVPPAVSSVAPTTPPTPAVAPVMPPFPGSAPAAPLMTPPTPVMPMANPVPLPTPDVSAPTTSEEQATIGAQIDNFVNQPAPAAPTPSAASMQDDAVLADAVQDLAESSEDKANEAPVMPAPLAPVAAPAPTPTPEPAPVAPMPAPEQAPVADVPTGSVTIANKKIIHPLSGPAVRPAIHELLAREQAAGLHGEAVVPPSPSTTFSPSGPGAPAIAPVDTTAGNLAAPPAPGKLADFDPNNISL